MLVSFEDLFLSFLHLQKFVDRMENETVDVKQLGLVGRTKEQILQELVELYALQ